MIGTPFVTQDEIHNRKIEHLDKKPWEQEARDDQGRKHFYGAFTGALRESSAGYKGTVGSKEGFQPKTFVSQRKRVRNQDQADVDDQDLKGEQADTKKQDILDFMDEEDLGEHHMPGSAMQVNVTKSHHNFFGGAGAPSAVESIKSICGQKGQEIMKMIASS